MAKGKGGARAAQIQLRPANRRPAPLNIARNIVETSWRESPVNPNMIIKAKGNRVARVLSGQSRLSGKLRYYVELFENGRMQGAAQEVSNLANGKRMGDIWVSRGE